jgi:hypothetical protein
LAAEETKEEQRPREVSLIRKELVGAASLKFDGTPEHLPLLEMMKNSEEAHRGSPRSSLNKQPGENESRSDQSFFQSLVAQKPWGLEFACLPERRMQPS